MSGDEEDRAWNLRRIPPSKSSEEAEDENGEDAPEAQEGLDDQDQQTPEDETAPGQPAGSAHDVTDQPPDVVPEGELLRIGIADTTFARMDMGGAAQDQLRASPHAGRIEIVRVTVPGFKDLPVAAKRLIDEQGCRIVIACGQAGPEPIDKQCAHEASLGIQQAQLMTNTHILEVFVHTDEVDPGQVQELKWLAEQRAREHADNALWMLFEPDRMRKLAGTGQREGYEDEGPIE